MARGKVPRQTHVWRGTLPGATSACAMHCPKRGGGMPASRSVTRTLVMTAADQRHQSGQLSMLSPKKAACGLADFSNLQRQTRWGACLANGGVTAGDVVLGPPCTPGCSGRSRPPRKPLSSVLITFSKSTSACSRLGSLISAPHRAAAQLATPVHSQSRHTNKHTYNQTNRQGLHAQAVHGRSWGPPPRCRCCGTCPGPPRTASCGPPRPPSSWRSSAPALPGCPPRSCPPCALTSSPSPRLGCRPPGQQHQTEVRVQGLGVQVPELSAADGSSG